MYLSVCIPHFSLSCHHIPPSILDSIDFSLDYFYQLGTFWTPMPIVVWRAKRFKAAKKSPSSPQSTKAGSRQRILLKAPAEGSQVRDPATINYTGSALLRARLSKSGSFSYASFLFAYPFLVVKCFKRYPNQRRSIFLSHFALSLSIFSAIVGRGIFPRGCVCAYRATSSLLEASIQGKVLFQLMAQIEAKLTLTEHPRCAPFYS